MSINYYNSASTPADNGTNITDPTVVTPPSSMQLGDLVIMQGRSRATAGTIAISATGGQTWNVTTQRNQSSCRTRVFWCVFNGTWSANPSISFGSALCNTAVMHVFRPPATNFTWLLDVAESGGVYAAPTTPFTVTIPAITTQAQNALVVAFWASADDNTWGSLTAGWNMLGSNQYRNTSGSDGSQSFAYKFQTKGTTGTVSKNQATLGGDAGTYGILAFKAVIPNRATATHNIGQYASSAIAIPANSSRMAHKIMRNSWVDTGSDVISVLVEASFDGGSTWPMLWGYTARGGNLVSGGDGSPITYSAIDFLFPDVGNANRRLRVTINTLASLNLADELEEII